jgi:hypothetical protein
VAKAIARHGVKGRPCIGEGPEDGFYNHRRYDPKKMKQKEEKFALQLQKILCAVIRV